MDQILHALFFLSVTLWVRFPTVQSLYLPSTYRTNSQGHASVSVGAITRTKRSTTVLPQVLSTTIIYNNTIIKLKLIRNNKINTPVYRSINRQIVKTSSHEIVSDYKFYQDITRHASFHVECNDQCTEQTLTGTFLYGGRFYLLVPSEGEQSSTSHNVFRLDTSHDLEMAFSSDASVPSSINVSKYYRRRRATDTYNVELILVVDYSVFRFWMDISQQNRTTAMDRINRYYAFLVNGLDIRFKNLPSATFTIGFVYSGIYISESSEDSYWTERNKLVMPSGETQIEAETTLAVFSHWIQNNTASLSYPDHSVLFTKYTLTKSGSSSIYGQAYLGAMCSSLSQSIVRDNFNFITQTVAAHEIGHSLGGIHDGDQNQCNKTAFYIMSSSSGAQPGDIARHPWIFSSCSVIEMKTVIDKLNNNRHNCLLVTSSQNVISTSQYISRPIGQEFNIDQQCQMIFGHSSYAYRASYKRDFRSICTGLWCSTGGNQLTLVLPAEGTTCGSQQWCSGYACVSDLNAPRSTENCTHGDTPFAAISGKTCIQYIQEQPWQCYSDSVFDVCCQSCLNSRIQNQDCIYGDVGDCSSLSPSDCYSVALEHQCCGFCNKHKTNKPGCMYGDHVAGCQRNLCPYYVNITLCCSTCSDFLTTLSPTTLTPLSTRTTKPNTVWTSSKTTQTNSRTTTPHSIISEKSTASTIITTLPRTVLTQQTDFTPKTSVPTNIGTSTSKPSTITTFRTTIPKATKTTTKPTTTNPLPRPPTTTIMSTSETSNLPFTTTNPPSSTIPPSTTSTIKSTIPPSATFTPPPTLPTMSSQPRPSPATTSSNKTTIPSSTTLTPPPTPTRTTMSTTTPSHTDTAITSTTPPPTESPFTFPSTTTTVTNSTSMSIGTTEDDVTIIDEPNSKFPSGAGIVSKKEASLVVPVVVVLCGLIFLLLLLLFFIAYRRSNEPRAARETSIIVHNERESSIKTSIDWNLVEPSELIFDNNGYIDDVTGNIVDRGTEMYQSDPFGNFIPREKARQTGTSSHMDESMPITSVGNINDNIKDLDISSHALSKQVHDGAVWIRKSVPAYDKRSNLRKHDLKLEETRHGQEIFCYKREPIDFNREEAQKGGQWNSNQPGFIRSESDTILKESIRDSRLMLRDKWLQEQQFQQLSHDFVTSENPQSQRQHIMQSGMFHVKSNRRDRKSVIRYKKDNEQLKSTPRSPRHMTKPYSQSPRHVSKLSPRSRRYVPRPSPRSTHLVTPPVNLSSGNDHEAYRKRILMYRDDGDEFFIVGGIGTTPRQKYSKGKPRIHRTEFSTFL